MYPIAAVAMLAVLILWEYGVAYDHSAAVRCCDAHRRTISIRVSDSRYGIMRITIVLGPFLPVPPVIGGAVEKVHLLLAEAYAAAGHQVTIVSRAYKNFAREEVVNGVRHIRVPAVDRTASLIRNLARDVQYALRVARWLPHSDITVTNSFSLPLLLPRSRAGKIYIHVARFPKHQMALYFRADRLQAISKAVEDAIVRQAPHLAGRITSIGYPVPDTYFLHEAMPAKHKRILFVGRIAREKGVHLLLNAFAAATTRDTSGMLAQWRLRIVGPHEVAQGGDGPGYLQELMRIARPLGAACEFTGPIFDESALVSEYKAASVFTYPSLAEKGEAFGLAALEAMAARCAVVVSKLQCFAEFVEDGVTGLTFDHRAPDAQQQLSSHLFRLMTNAQLVPALARQGYCTACRFATPAISARMLDDFSSLLGLPHAGRARQSETAGNQTEQTIRR
jgi:glycosyltransferase involved in cell wall biosynthesis